MAFFSMLKQFYKLSLSSNIKPNIILGGIRHGTSILQARRKRRFTMPPYWLPRPTRVMFPEALTKPNVDFINEVATNEETESPLNLKLYNRLEYKTGSIRCGLLVTKIGSHPMWTKDGKRHLVSLLHVSDNEVVKYICPRKTLSCRNRLQFKKRPKRGTLIVGSDSINPQMTTRGYYNYFEDTGVAPKKRLTKFYITEDAILPSGTPLYAGHFKVTDRIDMMATSVDRGFQGGMKRWKFHGQPAGHGNTKSHRRIGSLATNRNKIWPGKKMPGHMGREKILHRGIQIVRIDTKYNVIYVNGSVTGPVGGYCVIFDSELKPHKRNTKNNPPPFFPTYMPEYGDKELPQDSYSENWKPFDDPPIAYEVPVEKGRKKK